MFVLLQFSTMVQQNLHRFECIRIVAQNQSTRKKGNDIHDTCHRIQNKFLDRSQAVKSEDRPIKGWPHRFPLQPAKQKRSPANIVDGKQILHYSYFLLGFVKKFFHQKWVVSFVKFLPSFFPSAMCCLVFGVEDAWKVSKTSKHHLVLIHSFCTCSSKSPALHIFNNLLCFQLWVHVGLRELSPRIVEFDSDCLKASLHSEVSPRLQFQAKNFHISKFPHPRITFCRAASICFAP